MPTIDIIDGVKVNIYPNEHPPPHFHVIYGEYEALIRISDLLILKGELPSKQFKKIINWAKDKQDNLNRIFNDLNLDM